MTEKKVSYAEPANYFPKEIRKKYGLGEYSELYKEQGEKKPVKKTAKKTTKKSK